MLTPGGRNPNGPCSVGDLARRLAVAPAAVATWIDEGLPALPDGRLDPYAVTNWLSWGRLERCPALARRWRTWLRWFTVPGRACHLVVHRAQACLLPEVRPLTWLVPEPGDAPGQRILARVWDEGEPAGAWRRLTRPAAADHTWACTDEVALEPTAVPVAGRAGFERLVAELAANFDYAYRQHLPPLLGPPRRSGTCLDLALACGAALDRPWRLVSGVVAHRGLANAHFWVEAEDAGGVWVPLDPTIPAVARMLGGDWRATVPLAVGRHDGRRIRIAAVPGPVDAVLAGVAGRLDAGGDEALCCTDWAMGDCAWSIAAA